MNSIDVLLLTKHDWANSGYRYMKSLESIGLKVIGLKGHEHQFKYPSRLKIDNRLSKKGKFHEDNVHPYFLEVPELKEEMERAKVIYLVHGVFINSGIDFQKKNVVVQHGGHNRRDPEKFNEIFNPIVSDTILQCPDLIDLGAKNEVLIYYPVDTNLLKPNYRSESEKVLIGHFPSNPETKGSCRILRVIDNLKRDPKIANKFIYVGSKIKWKKLKYGFAKWEDQLNRIEKSDIIIETLNLDLYGKKYGEWGNTALEASALGCAVITNSLTQDIYRKEYGSCALNIANDENELERQLRKLINHGNLVQEKKKARDWVVKKHSIEVTGKRLWEKVFKKFFEDRK